MFQSPLSSPGRPDSYRAGLRYQQPAFRPPISPPPSSPTFLSQSNLELGRYLGSRGPARPRRNYRPVPGSPAGPPQSPPPRRPPPRPRHRAPPARQQPQAENPPFIFFGNRKPLNNLGRGKGGDIIREDYYEGDDKFKSPVERFPESGKDDFDFSDFDDFNFDNGENNDENEINDFSADKTGNKNELFNSPTQFESELERKKEFDEKHEQMDFSYSREGLEMFKRSKNRKPTYKDPYRRPDGTNSGLQGERRQPAGPEEDHFPPLFGFGDFSAEGFGDFDFEQVDESARPARTITEEMRNDKGEDDYDDYRQHEQGEGFLKGKKYNFNGKNIFRAIYLSFEFFLQYPTSLT